MTTGSQEVSSASSGARRPGQRLADLLDRSLGGVMALVEVPLAGLERLCGKKRMPYFFLAPALVLFGIFTFLPIAISIAYAFTGGADLFVNERPYVGLDNFRQLLACDNYFEPGTCRESLFWTAIWNTSWFVGFNVVATLLVALITALILNRAMAARGFFRAMFFYPVLLSPVVIGLIWKWFLDRNGLLNAMLQMLGVPPEIFLLEVGWSRFFVVVVSVWFHMGFYTLILLAGLQAIPKDLYEAAAIDAASPRRVFWRITLPLLAPNLLVVLILLMIRSVQIFDEAWVLTNGGGPGTANSFLVQYIYQTAFAGDLRLFGLASAAATLMGGLLLVLTLLQLALGKKVET